MNRYAGSHVMAIDDGCQRQIQRLSNFVSGNRGWLRKKYGRAEKYEDTKKITPSTQAFATHH
jgi:hypothetical protein